MALNATHLRFRHTPLHNSTYPPKYAVQKHLQYRIWYITDMPPSMGVQLQPFPYMKAPKHSNVTKPDSITI